jgi:hypothetical protein
MKPGQGIGKHSGKRATKAQMQATFVLFQAAFPGALPAGGQEKGLSALSTYCKKQFKMKFVNPSCGTPARVTKISSQVLTHRFKLQREIELLQLYY